MQPSPCPHRAPSLFAHTHTDEQLAESDWSRAGGALQLFSVAVTVVTVILMAIMIIVITTSILKIIIISLSLCPSLSHSVLLRASCCNYPQLSALSLSLSLFIFLPFPCSPFFSLFLILHLLSPHAVQNPPFHYAPALLLLPFS